MGRFFSGEDVFESAVPTAEAFHQVERTLAEELGGGEAVSAAVFGSVGLGLHTARSDLDVIIIAKEGAGLRLHTGRLANLYTEAARRHVPLQMIVLDADEARRPGNSIGPGLYAHLREARLIAGDKDPWTFLTAPPADTLAEAAEYRGLQRNRLQQRMHRWRAMPPSERLRALAQAADGPVHLARKITHAMTDVMHTDRTGLLAAFGEVAEAHDAPDAIEALTHGVELNRAYGSRLFAAPFKLHGSERLRKEFKSVHDYESSLDKLWGDLARQAWQFYKACDALFP